MGKRILVNNDVASLYPNLVRIFGYSSRNQVDKDAYVNVLATRIKAKHKLLEQSFLDEFGVTMKEVNMGLKLPINAYTGALRAKFNALFDNLQGFSICITGQLLLIQLAKDLQTVSTLELVEMNTDAVKYYIDEDYKEEADKVLLEWQQLTGLELEEDNVVKCIARDVNNYCEILQTEDNDYVVNYKGGCFRGKHEFKWNKQTHKFNYTFSDDLKSNSLTICSEAILKELLFDIPCEETIRNCNDVFRFQTISHLGGTYLYMAQQVGDKYVELPQRNNRIYAGKKKSGMIYKVKYNDKGELRYDKLADCPINPIVDNKNELGIEDINKEWYIKYTKQKINDFIGGKEIFMEEKLDKLKKDELIEMVKELKENQENVMTREREWKTIPESSDTQLYRKINKFRQIIRTRNFILDKVLPSNLGGGEYYSTDQIYKAIQDTCVEVGLDFSFEVVNVDRFDLAAFKPATGAPQNIATVSCMITFTDIDTGRSKYYKVMSQGSDSIDKAVNSASSYALRNWFDKNFTPKYINGEEIKFGEDNNFSVETTPVEQKSQPKTKTFVPNEKKEQIVKEITKEPQKSEDNKDDVDKLTNLIYEYRELTGNNKAGANKLDAIIKGEYTDLDILNWTLSFENAVADAKAGV